MTNFQPMGVVHSEFAQVMVHLDEQANGPRLRLEDLKTGRVRFLDALELETLVWLREERLWGLLDPSADRWREDRLPEDDHEAGGDQADGSEDEDPLDAYPAAVSAARAPDVSQNAGIGSGT